MPTDFLWAAGTSNNGLVTTAITLLGGTSELDGLTSGSVIVSSVSGASGVFTNSTTSQAMLADIFFSVGNPGISSALNAGACLSGWFLTSLDGGTTFESTTVAPPRPPDFIIPLPASTIAASAPPFRTIQPVILPALEFKVLVQNNTGQTLGSGATTAPYLKAAPYAMQY